MRDVPNGAVILHEDDADASSHGTMPLSYDILFRRRYTVGMILATKPLCLYSAFCDRAYSASEQLSDAFNGVKFFHFGSNDHKHDHDKKDGGLGSFLEVLEFSQRYDFPVYYYNNRTDEITEVTIGDSLVGLQILRICDSNDACMDAVGRYFSELRSKEPERKAQVAAEP